MYACILNVPQALCWTDVPLSSSCMLFCVLLDVEDLAKQNKRSCCARIAAAVRSTKSF